MRDVELIQGIFGIAYIIPLSFAIRFHHLINIRALSNTFYFGKPTHLFSKVKRENHQILLNQKPANVVLSILVPCFSCYFMVSDNKDGDLRMFGT